MSDMRKDIKEILFTEEQLKQKVAELGKKISEDYKGKKLLLVCVLKGATTFMTDLMRAIDIECKIDFMCVSSYGASTTSSGQVRIILDLRQPIEDYDLLLVEDILDSGVTLFNLREMLLTRKPKSFAIATLLDKPSRRVADVHADYLGFQIPDAFVVGYGLDYDEKYRNLPYIGILKPEVYTK